MTPSLHELASRRAHIRAIAAGLVDAPPRASRFRIDAGRRLQRSPRRRRSGREPRPMPAEPRRSPTRRRAVAAAVLLVQVGVLVALFTVPAFRVREVVVSGDALLGRDTVLAAAHVPQSSLFAVDSDGIRSRLARMPWVRTVSVTTQLPSTVHINLTEWQPELVLRRGATRAFVASTGATLPVGAADVALAATLPLLLDNRPAAAGALPDGLPDLIGAAAQRWPAVFGGPVAAVVWSSGGVLSVWSAAGWEAIIGHVDTAAALADVPNQLAVLAALGGKLDFAKPHFGYVDLENPTELAIGGAPGLPAWLSAEITGAPAPAAASAVPAATPTAAPTPAAAPTPTPAPTPVPSPTPVTLGSAPPSASPSP